MNQILRLPSEGGEEHGAAESTATMGRDLSYREQLLEDDYIDMDISSPASTRSSPATFPCYTAASSPSHSREFEFHPCVVAADRSGEASSHTPADELFYKGKLLPLHLPPRLQMVEKLLLCSAQPDAATVATERAVSATGEPFYGTSSAAAGTCSSVASGSITPFESCVASPSTSHCASGELDPDEYYVSSSAMVDFSDPMPKKPWSKKLRLIKQASLGQKIRASKAYFRSFFSKPRGVCSDEPCAVSGGRDSSSDGYGKASRRKHFFGHGHAFEERWHLGEQRKMVTSDDNVAHRRSFSGAIKHGAASAKLSSSVSSSSSSSSCSSSSSSSFSGSSPVLKRSSSDSSETENPILGAIAYCKKSFQVSPARKSVGDVACCTVSTAARIAAACEGKDRPGICRG